MRSVARKIKKRIFKEEKPLRIGVITNLVLADNFVRNKMASATSDEWMMALGGNTGNIAFVEGILRTLGNEYEIIGRGDNPKVTHKHFDHIVVCCANQIGPHFELTTWAKALEAYNLPVTLIGLGAQSSSVDEVPNLSKGSRYFLDVVNGLRPSSKYPNVISTGEYSSQILKNLGVDSKPFGCPSLFISAEVNLGKKCLLQQDKVASKIMVAGGNAWGNEFAFERILTSLVDVYGGNYVIQHPQAMLKIASDEFDDMSQEELKVLRRAYAHLGTDQEIHRWFRANSVFFADVQNWMHYSGRFSSVIGPRYHGVAIPIQAGVPGKVVSIDSRTEELPKTTGIPYLHYETVMNLAVKDLAELSRWSRDDADRFDDVRSVNSECYISFLRENGISPSAHLCEISKS